MTTRSLILPDILVRAALAGRVMEIRVPVRPQPDDDGLSRRIDPPEPFWRDTSGRKYRCPLGMAGDRLVVREAFALGGSYDGSGEDSVFVVWRADARGALRKDMSHQFSPSQVDAPERWSAASNIPMWASRLSFDVLGSRCELLQDITEDGAIASGAFYTEHAPRGFQTAPGGSNPPPGWAMVPTTSSDECLGSARMAYANFWNRWCAGENWNLKPGPSPWDLNELVWCAKVRIA
jgi:hypothetical protein